MSQLEGYEDAANQISLLGALSSTLTLSGYHGKPLDGTGSAL
jgi:hypothetical protein